jgi:hypothetical protein
MSGYKFTPQANEDLFEIWGHIARDDPRAAKPLGQRKFQNPHPLKNKTQRDAAPKSNACSTRQTPLQ